MINNTKKQEQHIVGTVNSVSEDDINKIRESIGSIQFGSVSIVIQNGRIIQIEKNEKIRLV